MERSQVRYPPRMIIIRYVPGWEYPIVIGRHAHADQYKCEQFQTDNIPGNKCSK